MAELRRLSEGPACAHAGLGVSRIEIYCTAELPFRLQVPAEPDAGGRLVPGTLAQVGAGGGQFRGGLRARNLLKLGLAQVGAGPGLGRARIRL